jgi:ribA/ribD-fused uncharacterized protein
MKYNIDKLKEDFRSGRKPKYIFFWGHQKRKDGEIGVSCFSQWWQSEFTIDNIKYFSAEHYMMAEKARLFNDSITLEKIINATSSKQTKQYGREVKGFNEDVWIANRYDIVKRGNAAKFSQNRQLKEFILSTKDKVIVEASPVDAIWGIGLAADNEHVKNPLKWRGLNLLGFALMEVRDELS